MAFFDWNNDGKINTEDSLLEYIFFRESTGEEDDDDDDLFDDSDEE